MLLPEPETLPASLFDSATGRIDWRALARHHVSQKYRGKSTRCDDCPVNARCEGLHINMIRDQGLALARPLQGDWAEEALAQLALWPAPRRIRDGLPPQPPAPSLPGFAPPAAPPEDPLRRANGLRRSDILRVLADGAVEGGGD